MCFLAAVAVWAQGPDEQYVRIYSLIQEADALNDSGQRGQAVAKYTEAQAALTRFPATYPGWNENVIRFRLNYVSAKLSPLVAKTPAATNTVAAPGATPPATSLELPAGQTNSLLRELQEELKRWKEDNANLAAKLKEALSVQPSALDPRELAKAQENNRNLQKQNELLKVTLSQEQEKTAQMIAPDLLAEANRTLAETKTKLEQQTQDLSALRTENEVLKKQVKSVEIRLAKGGAEGSKEAVREVKQLQEQLNKQAEAAKVEAKKRKQLEDELAGFRAKLQLAEKKLGQRSAKALSEAARKELESLQARLQVLEAKPTPYTAEELAALRKPGVELAVSTSEPKAAAGQGAAPGSEAKPAATGRTVQELPPGSGALAAAAQRAFKNGRFEEAEKNFLDILHQDEKNVYTLGEVAFIQIKLKKFDEAEKHLNTALGVDPKDGFCLCRMGWVKYERGKLDEALTFLSQAAQVDVDRVELQTEVQNCLGIVLAEKGLRNQAEVAFRKVIQMRPNDAEAHNNLAFVYATQKPPSLALARWHYQKAMANGQPKNPELEKLLGE